MPKRYKVLITGSSGMLGVDLCQELDKNYDVFGMDIIDHRPKTTDQKFIKADITDYKTISGILGKIKPDIVIHAAAWTDVDGCEQDPAKAYRVNSRGTENIAIACKKAKAALIYASTDFVFDGRKDRPYKETDKPSPINVYGDSKLKGEKNIRKTLKNYFILRTSWLCGKRGKNFVDTILAKAKRDRVLKVVDDQVGSPTYTKDLSKAIHRLLDRTRPETGDHRPKYYGIYHVSNSGRVSWYGYAKEILRLAGCKCRVLPISSMELGRPARRPAMSVLDNSKFFKFTGYRMRLWKDALREYLRQG